MLVISRTPDEETKRINLYLVEGYTLVLRAPDGTETVLEPRSLLGSLTVEDLRRSQCRVGLDFPPWCQILRNEIARKDGQFTAYDGNKLVLVPRNQ